MGLLYGENFVIPTSTVFDWSTRLTDGQMDAYSMLSVCYMLWRAKNWRHGMDWAAYRWGETLNEVWPPRDFLLSL